MFKNFCRRPGRVVKNAHIDGERDQHGSGSKPTRFTLTIPHCPLLGGFSKQL